MSPTLDVLATMRIGERTVSLLIGVAQVAEEQDSGRQVLQIRLGALPSDGCLFVYLNELLITACESNAGRGQK